MGLTNYFGYGYLVATRKQKIYTITVTTGTIINIICNWFFIQVKGAIGAAVASVISETCVLIFQLLYVRKEMKLKEVFNGTCHYLILAAIMYVIVFFISKELSPSIIHTIIAVAAGIAVYLIPLVIRKDQYLYDKCICQVKIQSHGI